MNKRHIINLLHEISQHVGVDLDSKALEAVDKLLRTYGLEDVDEFIRDVREIANDSGIVMLKKELKRADFELLVENFDAPLITFLHEGGEIFPSIIDTNRKKKDITILNDHTKQSVDLSQVQQEHFVTNDDGEILVVSVFQYESMVSHDQREDEDEALPLSPLARLIKLLRTEKKDIFYIYVYAVIIGISSLILPLGIQAAIELISGGVFFSSIYILIGVIIVGVLGAGVLQVLQITIVEYIQRRVFTKAAFEFAFRVPRIKMEAIHNIHFPELMNRFFDVLTIQKGLPKLLIDLSTGVIQILFGLILLSLYHPFFVFFGLSLILILFFIFYSTGPKGLSSSIIESKYKYKAVYWLEELARVLYSFKLFGTTELPIRKTDYFVNNYLKNRRNHFKVLISQYSYVLLFKAVVTAGLLIIGTWLVVEREITLGQFVASEVIIILILNSVEKIISYMDVVYDMLTAVDKISNVTDLPLEKTGGIDIPIYETGEKEGFSVELKNLRYAYPEAGSSAVEDINLSITKGQKVCFAGIGGSGKTTLTNLIAGMYVDYDGSITYNDYSLRDVDRVHLRNMIGKNVSSQDIFEGTILENILVGKPGADESVAIEAIKAVNLATEVNELPLGLNTPILAAGKGFSETFIQKLILARCLAKDPKLLILNDYFSNFSKQDKLSLLQMLTHDVQRWTLIVVSNDPLIMAACDRVIYMKKGKVLEDGPFEEILKNEEIVKNLN